MTENVTKEYNDAVNIENGNDGIMSAQRAIREKTPWLEGSLGKAPGKPPPSSDMRNIGVPAR